MKVELQCGDTITIPEGCKAIVKDGSVVFEKVQEFKDGDILAHINDSNCPCPFIYKDTDARGFYQYYVGVDSRDNIILPDNVEKRWGNRALRYATEDEKQFLFNKMEEQGLQWNAEEKKVEKIRWRAKKGEAYYRLGLGDVVFREIDARTDTDNMFYNTLNYFHTEGQAIEVVKRRKETLRKYHEEIGE